MITAMIIVFSVILAAAYFVAWLTKPDLRKQIEYPKHCFQDQLRQYDQQCREEQERTRNPSR